MTRPFLPAAWVLVLTLGGSPSPESPDTAQEVDVAAAQAVTRNSRLAIEKGLDSLARRQAEHGSIGDEYVLASTSLAGLAFLAGGSQYNRGKHGAEVRKCLEFLTKSWTPTGLFHVSADPKKDGRMHSQGYALLFLAQIYGMVPPEDAAQMGLKEKMHKTIDTVLDAQTPNGGWGYHFRGDAEFVAMDEASTTVCQIQALRACRNAGLTVDREKIDRAVDYVRRCAKDDGSFRYSITAGDTRSSYELTAAAVSTLNASGAYDSKEGKAGLDFMSEVLRKQKKPAEAAQNFFFYGNFYAAQALFQSGGEPWRRYYPEIRDHLVDRQLPDGSWKNTRGVTYATAMAVLVLELPLEYLPIFQR